MELSQIASTSQVLLLGDTEHANADIKRCIASQLGVLRAMGYTTLAIEVDASKQPLLDTLRPDMDMTVFAKSKLGVKHYEGIAALLQSAVAQGMKVVCVDDKHLSQEVCQSHPDFKPLMQAFTTLYHVIGDEAEQAALKVFKEKCPEQYADYVDTYAEWKQARADTDKALASNIEKLVNRGERVVAVLGQSHLARSNGVPFLLEQHGFDASHLDVYENQAALNSFLNRTFERSENKLPPQHVYFMDNREMVNLVNRETPSRHISQVYQHMPVNSLSSQESRAIH